MSDPYLDYWVECVGISLDERNIVVTEQQILEIAKDMQGAHEMYGMAFGHDCIPNPLKTEIKQLEGKLVKQEECNNSREQNWRNAVARAAGYRPDSVWVKMDSRGNVDIERRR